MLPTTAELRPDLSVTAVNFARLSPRENELMLINPSPAQLAAFDFLARGKTSAEVAIKMGMAFGTFKNQVLTPALRMLGARTCNSAINTLVDAGIFDPSEVTTGYDFSRFGNLNPEDKRQLEAFQNDPSAKQADLALGLGVSFKTVRNRFSQLHAKLDTRTLAQLLVVNRAYQGLLAQGYDEPYQKDEASLQSIQVEIYTHLAEGGSLRTVSIQTGYAEKTLRNLNSTTLGRNGALNRVELALRLASEREVLTPEVCNGAEIDDFKRLPSSVIQTLDALIILPHSDRSIRRMLSKRRGLSEKMVRNQLADASHLFGNISTLRLAVLYLAYKRGVSTDSVRSE